MNELMIIEQTDEKKALSAKVSSVWGLAPNKAEGLIAKYGEPIIFYALEVRQSKLTVGLGHFRALVQKGLTPEQVKTLYITKALCYDRAKRNERWCSVSLVQLARLAQTFEDFRLGDENDQFEMIDEALAVYRHAGFVFAVDRIIKRAQELGIGRLQDMLAAADDFADGTVFNTFFEDDEEHDW